MAEFELGMNAKLYRAAALLTDDDAAEAESASWTEITNVRDNTVNTNKGEADTTTRGNNGWRTTAGTLKELTLEFEMIWKPEDTSFAAIRAAYLNNTQIALAAMDGDIETNGSQGPVGNFDIINFTRSEPLEDVQKVSVTAKFASFPQWYTVGSS